MQTIKVKNGGKAFNIAGTIVFSRRGMMYKQKSYIIKGKMSTKETDWLSVGLNDRQVEESRARHGSNELTPPKRPSMWSFIWRNSRIP